MLCRFEQHVKRIGGITGCRLDIHVDPEFLFPEPSVYTRHVVLFQEGEVFNCRRSRDLFSSTPRRTKMPRIVL